jgi:hypothetical protein
MGWFFLFWVVRPKGDAPVTWSFEKVKDDKAKV